jgi:hypothetical protein
VPKVYALVTGCGCPVQYPRHAGFHVLEGHFMSYGTPPMSQMPGGTMKPHRGTMILVFGILGFLCVIFSIIAWIMGGSDLKEMRAGRMDPSGESLTKVGWILGIVLTLLNVAAVLVYVIVIVLVVGAGVAGGGYNP